ncbi:hypothetical protein WMF20_35515 [Sorangium sp. So ce834]|uniref:hypothetical protein n=1 Tax=Sorangium sp. So ce834 TaxID=3133321 RepID=UPI003F5E1E05
MLLTVRGVLKVTYLSDPKDIKPGPPRERIRRFRERVDAAMAAESIKVEPRALDEVLWSDFDGPWLERDMATRGSNGVQVWLERVTRGAVS